MGHFFEGQIIIDLAHYIIIARIASHTLRLKMPGSWSSSSLTLLLELLLLLGAGVWGGTVLSSTPRLVLVPGVSCCL